MNVLEWMKAAISGSASDEIKIRLHSNLSDVNRCIRSVETGIKEVDKSIARQQKDRNRLEQELAKLLEQKAFLEKL